MSASLIFTADATTDIITSAGHGLVTGDGPIAARNTGGALPGGLAAVTDYFFIRIDASTGRLATSSANALAGTAINLTTNGTGTNRLEVGIPYRRARTYAAGSQVKSLDLNALQDAFVAIHEVFTGQPQTVWDTAVIAGALTAGGLTLPVNQHVTVSGAGRYKHGTLELDILTRIPQQYTAGVAGNPNPPGVGSSINGTGATSGFAAQFILPVGKRIQNVKASVQESTSGGTDRVQVSLVRLSNAAGSTLVGTGSPSAGNNTIQTILFNANHTVLTVASYFAVVNFALGSAVTNIYRMWVEYDEP